MKIALLANGPGEVWGWCRPFIYEAVQRGWMVDVHLLPCPYASGREFSVLTGLPAHVVWYKNSLKALRSFRSSQKYDAVLQMGGDLLFGRALARKQKIPLACYSYGLKKGMEHCDVVMTSRLGLYKIDRLEIVGDLVLDSLDPGVPEKWSAVEGKRVAVFPGSRPQIRRKAFLFLQEIRRNLTLIAPDVELRVLLSPFAEENEIQTWRDEGFSVWTGTTPAGISGADLALTQPGTNTLELLYSRQPFAVTVPYSFLRQMPLSGLIGMVDKIPAIGAALRERIIRSRMPHYIGKTAWPNRLAGKIIVPELIGEYNARQMAESVFKILSDHEALAAQRKQLDKLASVVLPGAPARICDIVERMTVHER